MAVQYVIYYKSHTPPGNGSVANLGIELALDATGDFFYGKYGGYEILEIHIIHSDGNNDEFTLTGTATGTLQPVIRSVDFTTGGSPEPSGGHFQWSETEATKTVTLKFEALPMVYEGGWVTWEFGKFEAPPTKLKVVVKRQKDPV